MQFLSDVYLRCTDCNGTRYREEILQIKVLPGTVEDGDLSTREALHAKSIAEVLALTVAEALQFFRAEPDVLRALQPLADVGLAYVELGQAVPTLSGGEAQRLKLAGHLAESARLRAKKSPAASRQGTLFLFDEPTTGLHFDDIATLMLAFRQLITAGHSLLVIEHNLDVIQGADWLIDIGPEGGQGGGRFIKEK